MNQLIKAQNISLKYDGHHHFTLKDISFELHEGESLGILGPNGGGKSTLMKILSGIHPKSGGELSLFGLEIRNLNEFPFKKISYVPQTSGINLSLPLRANEYLKYAAESMNIKNAESKILEMAKKVGIEEKLHFLFRDMSGGEKQRVLLCKALLNDPQILLLDEPTKGLDSLGQDQLLNVIEKIKNENKTAVVIVDHNINQIIRHCDKVLCLNKTSHWHDHKDLLTKNVLENIYHCEFEHLLIHENENGQQANTHEHHQFCDHDHQEVNEVKPHSFLWRKK